MTQLSALRNNILFKFLDETGGSKGMFTDRKTPGGIVLPTLQSEQKDSRWGLVTHVGPDVDGVSPGDYIFIEPLMWSFGTVVDGEKLWKTDDTKILFVTDDPADTVRT